MTYYHSNHLYSVAALTDETGSLVERYGYGPYGDSVVYDASGAVIAESTVGNPYRFTGRRFDSETGLSYFRARYMDHEMGRFVGRDPFGYVDGQSSYRGWFVPFQLDPSGTKVIEAPLAHNPNIPEPGTHDTWVKIEISEKMCVKCQDTEVSDLPEEWGGYRPCAGGWWLKPGGVEREGFPLYYRANPSTETIHVVFMQWSKREGDMSARRRKATDIWIQRLTKWHDENIDKMISDINDIGKGLDEYPCVYTSKEDCESSVLGLLRKKYLQGAIDVTRPPVEWGAQVNPLDGWEAPPPAEPDPDDGPGDSFN